MCIMSGHTVMVDTYIQQGPYVLGRPSVMYCHMQLAATSFVGWSLVRLSTSMRKATAWASNDIPQEFPPARDCRMLPIGEKYFCQR